MHFRFKKLLLLTALVITGVTLAACSNNNATNKDHTIKSGNLVIGLEGTYAPYSYHSDGKLVGFEVELGKALAKDLHLKPVFVQSKWDSLIAGIDSKKYDVVLNNVAVTSDRQKSYAFTSPYLYSKSVLMLKKGTDIKSISEIKGMKIADDPTSLNGQLAKKLGANLVSVPGFLEAISLIESGQAKGSINSKEAFFAYKQKNPNTDLTTIDIDQKIAPAQQVAGILAKNNPKLRENLDASLKKLKDNGTLTKLSNKYFGDDVTKK